jgi:DNA end-binding protein Ku
MFLSRQPEGEFSAISESNPLTLKSMRALWKGTISFCLVNIPVSLFPATRREDLKFHLLRRSDLSPINYKRVAEADGKEVPWDEIVKGYEYERGEFVVLKEEDFARVDVEATRTVDIFNFVEIDQVDPLLFYKPYYLEVQRGGDKAYVLLRDSLAESHRIAIAKVVIRERQHLAAIKPQNKGLILELMHFPEELLNTSEFNTPAAKSIRKNEMQMAKQLIESMSSEWDPSQYSDEYHDALERMIEKKIESGGKAAPPPAKKKRPTNVVDLMSVLLREKTHESESKKPTKRTRSKGRKKAA